MLICLVWYHIFYKVLFVKSITTSKNMAKAPIPLQAQDVKPLRSGLSVTWHFVLDQKSKI